MSNSQFNGSFLYVVLFLKFFLYVSLWDLPHIYHFSPTTENSSYCIHTEKNIQKACWNILRESLNSKKADFYLWITVLPLNKHRPHIEQKFYLKEKITSIFIEPLFSCEKGLKNSSKHRFVQEQYKTFFQKRSCNCT